jgi:hypothetical protein
MSAPANHISFAAEITGAKQPRTSSCSNQNAAKSTNPTFILSLITAWLQVLVLLCPPHGPFVFDF